MYFLTCFPFQIQVPNYRTVLNFWRKAYFCIASHDIQYLMSEWHDKGAILPSGLKHVLKQGMKILRISVNWKWDRLVTFWLALVQWVNCPKDNLELSEELRWHSKRVGISYGKRAISVRAIEYCRRCPGKVAITGNSLPVTPRGRANKQRQTVHKPQIKEKQN